MSKKSKLYNIRTKMMSDIQEVKLLLEFLTYKTENLLEASVLGHIALEKTRKIDKSSEKIGKILKL